VRILEALSEAEMIEMREREREDKKEKKDKFSGSFGMVDNFVGRTDENEEEKSDGDLDDL
jgi:hypothetical protein